MCLATDRGLITSKTLWDPYFLSYLPKCLFNQLRRIATDTLCDFSVRKVRYENSWAAKENIVRKLTFRRGVSKCTKGVFDSHYIFFTILVQKNIHDMTSIRSSSNLVPNTPYLGDGVPLASVCLSSLEIQNHSPIIPLFITHHKLL